MVSARTRTVAFVTILTVLSVVALLLFRTRTSNWTPPAGAAREAENTRATFRASPVARITEPAAVIAALGAGRSFSAVHNTPDGDDIELVEEPDTLTEAQFDALRKTVSDFLAARASANAETYAEWMTNRDYTLKPLDEEIDGKPGLTTRHPGYAHRFKLAAGREISQADTPWTVFRDAFEGECRRHNTTPTGISTGPGAVEIWLATAVGTGGAPVYDILTPFQPVFFARAETLADEPDAPMYWADGQQYDGWPHWKPPVSVEEVLDRDGSVQIARIHFIIRNDRDVVLPADMILFYDPRSGMWHLPDRRAAFEYANTYAIPLYAGPEF